METKTYLGFMLAFLFLGIGLDHSKAASRNLIPCNSGFEVGTGGWRYYIRESGITTPPHYDYKFISPQALTNGAPEGRYYVHLQPDGAMGWVFEPFAVKLAPNKSYTLSAYVKGQGIARMELVPMGNQMLGSVELKPGPSWQRYTLTVKTPKDFNGWVSARFVGYRTPLDLDAVQLEEGESATDYQPVKSIEVGGEASRRFHLFDAGEEAKATVRLAVHGGQPREISLNWEVQDHRLVAVSKGAKKITLIPGEPYNFELPIDTKLKGGFRIALTAKDPATGDENFFPIVYAVIPKPIPCKDPSKSPFCTETYLIVGPTGTYRVYYGYTSVAEFQDLMQRLGMHGSREQFWCVPQAIEKSKATGKPVDWYDWWIDGLLKRQIQPYICLIMTTGGLGFPGWGDTDEPFCSWSKSKVPKEESIRYQVREIVNHFKGRVKVYEIGWETESNATAENFAKVAKWMADEARKTDPQAKIVGLCPSVDPAWADPQKRDHSWLGRTLPLVKGVFDGFTAHYLTAVSSPVDDASPGRPSAAEVIKGMNELLVKNGMQPRTWSDTEVGYSGSTMYAPYEASMLPLNPSSIRLQAENVVRGMMVGLSLGIERWHYFIFNCTANQDMAPFEWNMMPRPLAAAWAQMGQRIENADYVGELKAPADVRAYLFKRDDGPCVVFWHKDCQDGAKLTMVLPGSGWTAEDIMGNPVNMRKPWYQRFVCSKTSLPLSSSAVYLFGPGLTEDFLRKSFTEAVVEGVKPRINLSRIFSGDVPPDLITSAYVFGGVVKEILYGALSSEKVNLCPAVDAYVFERGNSNTAVMVWSKTMEGLKLEFALDTTKVEIQDVYSRPMPKTAQDGIIKAIPIGSHPVVISGHGIGMAEMKKAVSESQIIGPPMFQVGRLSMANPKPGEPAAFVVPVRNDGTKPLSGKVQLKGAPAEWGMPETAAFENIGRSEMRLVYFTPKTLPKLVEGIKLEGNVELSSGEKAVVAPRIINIARCPRGPEPKLDGDLKSEEWASANWFVVARKEQIAFGADQWKGPEDGSMKVGMLRGERLWYLGIQVKDDLVKNTAVPAQLYLEDAIEVWLEAEPDKDLFSAEANPKHTGVVTFAARGDVERTKRIVTTAALYQISDLYSCQAEFRKTGTGYILEIMIPLNQQKVLPGTVIGFDIGFDDADQYQRKCQMIWSGYGRNSHDPSRYGFLIFE